MLFLHNIYAGIYSRIWRSTDKMSSYKREIIVAVLAHVIAAYYLIIRIFNSRLSAIGIGEFDRLCFLTLLILAISIFASGKDRKIRELNRKVSWIYSALSICLLISVIICRFVPERSMDIFMVILLIPMVMITLSDENDFFRLTVKMSAAFVNAGVFLHVVNLLFARQEEGVASGYQGLIANPNTLAMALLPTLFCAVYLYLMGKNRAYYLAVTAYTAGVIVMTQSRTSFAMAFIGIFCCVIFGIRYSRVIAKSVSKQLVAVLLLIVVTVAGIFLTDKLNELVAVKGEGQMETAQTEDSSWGQLINKSKARMDTGMNGFLSGRVELWKYYTEDITPFGHDSVTAAREREKDGITLGAHNTLIYYLYNNGVTTAFFMLLFQAAGCIYVVISFIGRRTEGEEGKVHVKNATFCAMMIPAYCAGGLVEDLSRIGGWGGVLMFYFAMTQVFLLETAAPAGRKKYAAKHSKKGKH